MDERQTNLITCQRRQRDLSPFEHVLPLRVPVDCATSAGDQTGHKEGQTRGPAPGDYGAHGRFDDRAKNQSVQVWATEHIGWRRGVAAVVITLAAAIGGALATLCQGRHKGEWGELGKAH